MLRKHKAFGTRKVLAREKLVYTGGNEIKLEIPRMAFARPKLLAREKSTQGED
jgi:hypothetical protein